MADNKRQVEPIPMVDFAAFMDSRWHEIVLWVCKMLETYTMTELWNMEIVRFTSLTHKAEQLQHQRMSDMRKPGKKT